MILSTVNSAAAIIKTSIVTFIIYQWLVEISPMFLTHRLSDVAFCSTHFMLYVGKVDFWAFLKCIYYTLPLYLRAEGCDDVQQRPRAVTELWQSICHIP